MKLVYICSPLSGDMEVNKQKAVEYCAFAARQGVIPLAPHTIFTQYLDDTDPSQRKQGLRMGLELLRRSDEIWVCGDRVSEGMRGEIRAATEEGIPVRYISRTTLLSQEADQSQEQAEAVLEEISEMQPVL